MPPAKNLSAGIKIVGIHTDRNVVDRSKHFFYYKLDGLTKKVKEYVRMFGTKNNISKMKRIRRGYGRRHKTFLDEVCTGDGLKDLRRTINKIEVKKSYLREIEKQINKEKSKLRLEQLKKLQDN